ncbi:MAG: hypothetical protein ING89_03440 [Rubrivivax sp.]|jgi:hypothetical protein|nr:hypothetical protein [Rubrivivax sp.]
MTADQETVMPPLDQEQQTYDKALPDMLKRSGEGQFVVIRGEEVCKFEPTYEQALSWGYEHFGLAPFLVRQVTAVQPQVYYSRYDDLCAG